MLSGISIPSLILILVIVVLIFGTKKLRNVGTDLGGAIKSFRKAVKTDDKEKVESKQSTAQTNVIENESQHEKSE